MLLRPMTVLITAFVCKESGRQKTVKVGKVRGTFHKKIFIVEVIGHIYIFCVTLLAALIALHVFSVTRGPSPAR